MWGWSLRLLRVTRYRNYPQLIVVKKSKLSETTSIRYENIWYVPWRLTQYSGVFSFLVLKRRPRMYLDWTMMRDQSSFTPNVKTGGWSTSPRRGFLSLSDCWPSVYVNCVYLFTQSRFPFWKWRNQSWCLWRLSPHLFRSSFSQVENLTW